MSTKMQTKVQASPAQSFTPVQTGLLQRKSALYNTPGLVEDSGRDKEKLTLQRSSVDQAETNTVPPIDPEIRDLMEPRFGHDFSRVRVHSTGRGMIQAKLKINEPGDPYEQEADRVADAVMRMPEPRLSSSVGDSSLANSTIPSSSTTQRVGASCSDQYKMTEDESRYVGPANLGPNCQTQKQGLIQTKQVTPLIQRQENLAEEEELIQAKIAGGVTPEVTPAISSGIHSLQGGGRSLSGVERSFFEPRFGADFSDVRVHSDARAANVARSVNARGFTLGRNVVFGDREYFPDALAGRKLLAHELTHVVQQCKAGSLPQIQRQTQPACSVRDIESCPTYEQWISAFTRLGTFLSEDGVPRSQGGRPQRFRVLGGIAASRDPAAAAVDRPPAPARGRFGDRFIDHPTDNWVQMNMPENLRRTAYQLPSDCADILVILRHVYLSAHHRTENYRGWVVGDELGRAAQRRIRGVIHNAFTGNLARVVNPYSDNQGNPIRDFARLEPLLHPGDQLVWDHHSNSLNRPRSGGHSQTIMDIRRNNAGHIDELHMLQGNQPLFLQQADDIIDQTNAERAAAGRPPLSRTRQAQLRARGGPVRSAPGRRIEVSIMRRNMMQDIQLPQRRGSASQPVRVWTWNDPDNTILNVAGSPRSATRPSTRRIGGQRHRRISDWFRALGRASSARLHGIFEAALHEARALIDGGHTVANQDATDLGHRAGNRLWRLARTAVSRLTRFGRSSGDLRRGDLGHRVHFDRLHRIRTMIRALGGIQPATYHGNPQAAQNVRTTFTRIDTEFNFAARGGNNISFTRRVRRGGELVKILVTGFDPFNTSDVRQPPRPGEWNPSGTAAMAMDGISLNLGGRNKAAVEGIVLPVSFAQFNQGIVERMVRQAGQDVDGVLTVSVDPNLAATAPVRIEQFAVGVRGLVQLQPHRLFPIERPAGTGMQATPGGGPAIIESNADVSGIAQDTAGRTRRRLPIVQQPTIGRDITMRFANISDARRAMSAIGLAQAITGNRVTISDEAAIRTIIGSMQRVSNQQGTIADITFRAGGQQFRATILRGPGGSFLSNEVSFRTQRKIRNQQSPTVSFHVHTPEGGQIPQDTSTRQVRRARRNALSGARDVANTLIATLRRMIRAIGQRVLARR